MKDRVSCLEHVDEQVFEPFKNLGLLPVCSHPASRKESADGSRKNIQRHFGSPPRLLDEYRTSADETACQDTSVWSVIKVVRDVRKQTGDDESTYNADCHPHRPNECRQKQGAPHDRKAFREKLGQVEQLPWMGDYS
jgi:hypothetical protein